MSSSTRITKISENGRLDTDGYQTIFDNIYQFGSGAFTLLMARDVGILDALLEAERSLTSKEVANSRSLKERYTRAILDCLVTIKLAKASRNEDNLHVYYLEESAKKVLSDLMNDSLILLPNVFMSCYKDVRQCLPLDGPMGVGYPEALYDLMKVSDKVDTLGLILQNVPELKTLLENGINVLELGSGSGSIIADMARKYPKSLFTASERNTELQKVLIKKLKHLPNAKARVFDLSDLPKQPDETFDWIIVKDVSHVVPHPGETTKGIRRLVAEPDGIFTFIDFVGKGDPMKSIGDMTEVYLYTFSLFFCLPLGFVQNPDSEAFGCCWSKEEAIKMAEGANFSVKTISFAKDQSLFVAKPII